MPAQAGPKPIRVNKWNLGIADSPFIGFAEMRNVDVITRPGVLQQTAQALATMPPAVTGTFTANAGTDILTGPNISYTSLGATVNGNRAVQFTTSGTLPAGLSLATTYFLIPQSATTYKVATTLVNALASTAIDITDAGSGTHTMTSINPGLFKHFPYDENASRLYALDENQRVWYFDGSQQWLLVDGNTRTSGTGNGATIAFNYLIVLRASNMDIYGPLSSSPIWTNGFKTIGAGTRIKPMRTGQDNIVYWGDDDGSNNPKLGSLQQIGTFDPSSSGTYTFNASALTLPKYKLVNCLEELGKQLMSGTTGKEIYPWDRSSATFDLPIICQEKNITALLNANNQLYIGAGNKGNLYLYNGYLALSFKVFPKHLLAKDYNTATIGAMATLGRKILYTVQTVANSGIYSVDALTQALVMENTISSGSAGTANGNPLTLPALFSDGSTYYASWKDLDQSTVGVDSSAASGGIYRYSTGFAYVVFPNLDIGYVNEPRTLQKVEVYFDRPLTTNQTCVIKYRQSLGDSFSTLATFTGDNVNQIFQANAAIISGSDVQFRIDLNTIDTAVNFYLQEIVIT